jgi:uncharacterized protein
VPRGIGGDSPQVPAPARDPRLDALRGFALAGILLVNIQSFLSGASNPMGYLPAAAGWADRVAYFVTAAFVVGKFMPLFGMLFGAGFALLYDKLAAASDDPRAAYRRRLLFLLVFGLLHGGLLYFGDITHTYAIAGFALLRYVQQDAADLGRAAARWWLAAVVWTLLLSMLAELTSGPTAGMTGDDWTAELTESVAFNAAASVALGYVAQWPLRFEMFLWQAQANLLSLPMVIALMLTGMLAERAGWLRDPAAPAWDNARRIGLAIGLPCGLIYGAWSAMNAEVADNLMMPGAMMVVQTAGLTLSFAYAVTILRHAPAWLVALLAPAGRMPLTNYLLQSLAMGLLLTGWGLGLGDALSYWQLSALALVIFAVQVLISRWWLARTAQGPLEALWRAWTAGSGRRVPPPP